MRFGLQTLPGLAAAVLAGADSGPNPLQSAVGTAETPPAHARTQGLSLEAALRLALEHAPSLRAARAQVDAAAGRARQATVWPNPELELATEDGPTRGGGLLSEAKQTLGVVQTLPFPGKKKLDQQIGRVHVRLGWAEHQRQRLELMREVKVAYCSVLAAERLAETARALEHVATSAAAATRQRVEAGAGAEQERLRAEIALEEARAGRVRWEQERAVARRTLALLLGRPDLQEVPLDGRLVETVDPAVLDLKPAHWLAHHPDIRAARLVQERAELERRRVQLDPYPDIQVGVAGGREAGPAHASILELRLTLPLPLLDRSKGRRQEAQANVELAEAELAAAEQRLERTWTLATGRVRAAAAQAAAYRDHILPRANEALRLVQRGFEEGRFGFLDLLDTQRTTAEAQLQYQQQLLELNTALAELEALLGWLPPPGPAPVHSRPATGQAIFPTSPQASP